MKVDLHRHLSGSAKSKTIYNLLRKQYGNNIITQEQVEDSMTFKPNEPKHFDTFLNKFKIFDSILWDEQALQMVLEHISWDIVKEKLDYVELKFSIDKYIKQNKHWTPQDVIKIIYEIMLNETDRWGFKLALVLSLKHESNKDDQRKFAKVLDKCHEMLVGIDIIGDERLFDCDFYKPIFKDWKAANKGLEAHVGETQPAENVRLAIEELGVSRIAHGITAANNKNILAMAKERNICFDIALTSNLYTGAVPNIQSHPIRKIIDAGCDITIGTDDPAILNTTLDNEYEILLDNFDISDEEIIKIMLNSVKYAFTNLNETYDIRREHGKSISHRPI